MSTENEDQELLDRAVLGKQVADFFNTDVGRYILNRANSEQMDAMSKLKVVDPTKTEEIRSLQNEIRVPELIVQWLQDAVSDGVQALNILESRE